MNLKKLFNIDRAVCLTLDKRYEQALEIQSEGLKYGLDIDLFIAGDGKTLDKYDRIDDNCLPLRYQQSTNYPTWYNTPNAYNAWKCHQKILLQAYKDGIDKLLLLEDDIKFEDDIESIITNAYNFLWNAQYYMLYFGYYSNGHTNPTINKNVRSACGIAGFHAVLITKDIIYKLATQFAALGPFDEMCGKYIHPNFKTYCIYPGVINQKSGFSYVENSHLDKPSRDKI